MEASNRRKDDTMKKNTFGKTVARLRKEQGITQQELADRMGVTDKAVSKWERDLSMPDTASLPLLAQTLGTTVDQLMNGGADTAAAAPEKEDLPALICRAVGLAMGVAVVALSLLKQLDLNTAAGLLGVGLTALSVHSFLRR